MWKRGKERIVVSQKRTFDAASEYKGMKTAVHNFASATNPGGGVVRGANAQEECLCRCSGLYFNLNEQRYVGWILQTTSCQSKSAS